MVKYLFEQKNVLEENIGTRHIMLMLDFDGTLSPIVNRPEKAQLPPQTRDMLGKLVQRSCCTLAIISGRKLEDIKNKVGLEQVIYVGNHGLELEGPKIHFKSPLPTQYADSLQELRQKLKEKFAQTKGVIIENKGLSFSVHYRLVDKNKVAFIKQVFHQETIPAVLAGKLKTKTGKMVLEVSPPVEWDKGKIVLWLLARQGFCLTKDALLPIFIGDDVTDEDAFCALRKKGLTIVVGRKEASAAQFYVNDTDEVRRFLGIVLERTN